MNERLKTIEITQIYELQEDIELFISNNQKSSSSLVSLKRSIIDILKSLFNKYTIICFSAFAISSTFSLYSLKLLGQFYQKTEQVGIASIFPDVLLSVFLLSASYAVVFALLSIILAQLYYKNKLLNQISRKKKKKSNLYEYLIQKSETKKQNKTKFKTINEFAFNLYEKYDLLELKLKEEQLRTEIEDHESSRSIVIIPFSIFFFLLSIFAFEIITGIPTKNLIDNFSLYSKGISFVIFTTTISNFALKLLLFNSVKFKKQALSALKKAQILITET